MIAPLPGYKPPQIDKRSPMREARRWIAATFLPERSSSGENVPAIASWKARLFTLWVIFVTAVYFAHMLGLFD
jgi:hypothetical protein